MNNIVNNSSGFDTTRFLNDIFLAAENSEDLTKRQLRSIKELSVNLITDDVIIFEVINNNDKILLESVSNVFFKKEIYNILDKEMTIFFKVKDKNSKETQESKSLENNSFISLKKETNDQFHIDDKTGLIKDLTFDNFIMADSNKMVYASAVALSEDSGNSEALKMLYIYGKPGLGKTHLLNAIGNNIIKIFPEKKVRYITSEEFLTIFLEALGKNKLNAFDKVYMNFDVLLIDDMQFFTVKQIETTNKFFHIVNKMISENKKIVFTADIEPKKLKGINERIISRITSGLYWEIQKPDFELREAYIKKYIEGKILPNNINFNNKSIKKIATIMKSNIRELQGAVDKVIFYCEINGEDISEGLIDKLLKSEAKRSLNEIDIQRITYIVSNYFNIPEEQIRGKKRTVNLVKARHIAIYLSRKLTNLTSTQIGMYFHRDHSSVITTEKKINEILTRNKQEYKEIDEIIKIINES